MGLEMYLEKKIYIGANYCNNNVQGEINLVKNDKPIKINLDKVTFVTESVAYWRKANQIHNWFVENVQDGEDDCRKYHVHFEKLQELVDTCVKVLDNHSLAKELLPTREGFFFGDTEYNKYYYKQLEDTVEALKDLKDNGDYYYEASW